MKNLYCICDSVQDAIETVRFLLENGMSAYRWKTEVWVDDGGVDLGI